MANTLDQAAANFLREHDLAVLATSNNEGEVHGAVVYYLADQDSEEIYIISRTESTKANDIRVHRKVALTIYDAPAMETLQISGVADIVEDPERFDMVYHGLIHPRPYQGEMLLPPVTALQQGDYILVRVVPVSAHHSSYKEIVRPKAS